MPTTKSAGRGKAGKSPSRSKAKRRSSTRKKTAKKASARAVKKTSKAAAKKSTRRTTTKKKSTATKKARSASASKKSKKKKAATASSRSRTGAKTAKKRAAKSRRTSAAAARDQLAPIRERLAQQRQEILNLYNHDLRIGQQTTEDGTEDIVDRANNAYNRELTFSISDGERELLILIEEAQQRLVDGSFGSCGHCGSTISEPRLQAVPWARYCIDCQELEEKGLLRDY